MDFEMLTGSSDRLAELAHLFAIGILRLPQRLNNGALSSSNPSRSVSSCLDLHQEKGLSVTQGFTSSISLTSGANLV
jgi:hypothetical protein